MQNHIICNICTKLQCSMQMCLLLLYLSDNNFNSSFSIYLHFSISNNHIFGKYIYKVSQEKIPIWPSWDRKGGAVSENAGPRAKKINETFKLNRNGETWHKQAHMPKEWHTTSVRHWIETANLSNPSWHEWAIGILLRSIFMYDSYVIKFWHTLWTYRFTPSYWTTSKFQL